MRYGSSCCCHTFSFSFLVLFPSFQKCEENEETGEVECRKIGGPRSDEDVFTDVSDIHARNAETRRKRQMIMMAIVGSIFFIIFGLLFLFTPAARIRAARVYFFARRFLCCNKLPILEGMANRLRKRIN